MINLVVGYADLIAEQAAAHYPVVIVRSTYWGVPLPDAEEIQLTERTDFDSFFQTLMSLPNHERHARRYTPWLIRSAQA